MSVQKNHLDAADADPYARDWPVGRAASAASEGLTIALEALAVDDHATVIDEIRDVLDQLRGRCEDKYVLDDGVCVGCRAPEWECDCDSALHPRRGAAPHSHPPTQPLSAQRTCAPDGKADSL